MEQKKILITFARHPLALNLARHLHTFGHQIFAADSLKHHLCSFSKAVSKTFHVPSPSHRPAEYLENLLQIVKEESVDLLLPIFEETACIAKHQERFPKNCSIFSPSFSLFRELHHKWLFQRRVEKIGLLPVPSLLISNQKELQEMKWNVPYLLKACYSRACQSISKYDPGHPLPKMEIDPENPLIAQKWIEGTKYCSYSVCHNGAIFAHALYPVQYAIGGNSCVMFESVSHPEIYEWICTFVRETNYTGQIAFDFIQTQDKKIYAIECNPRATSGLYLFNKEDRLDHAIFAKNKTAIFSKVGEKKQIGMGMLLYGWKKSSLPGNSWGRFFKDFFRIQDVVFQLDDIKPFLLKPFIFALLMRHAIQSKLPLPEYFTYDHHWNGENL